MPTDKKGKFHLGTQRAHAADREAAPKAAKEPPTEGAPEHNMNDGEGAHTSLHEHGDGTYHTEGHDGERVEHPHIGHALMHMAAKHGGGGTHMHAHHDGVSHVTHHVRDGGEVEGPHEHPDAEAMKEHMGSVFEDGGDGHHEMAMDRGGKGTCASGSW